MPFEARGKRNVNFDGDAFAETEKSFLRALSPTTTTRPRRPTLSLPFSFCGYLTVL